MSNNFPFELGAFARASDPATSHKAVTPKRKRGWNTQEMLLLTQYVMHGGLTDEEAANLAHLAGRAKSPWRRCTDLRKKGLIRPTGEERRSACDSLQMICEPTEAGRAALTSK